MGGGVWIRAGSCCTEEREVTATITEEVTGCLIAPTERPPITRLGTVSSLPEKLGVDILWETPLGLAGVQRKTTMDLIASVRDGRLGREFEQMQQLRVGVLVIEGSPSWDAGGNLQTQHTRWTIKQQWSIECSAQEHGIQVLHTRNAQETCDNVLYLQERHSKERSRLTSLLARPSPTKNGWGRLDDKATAVHLLTGFPSIGMELAERIFDHFGGIPIAWTITKQELMEVKGMGKRRADVLWRTMNTPEGNEWWIPWLAALIDGEGTITFTQAPDKRGLYEKVFVSNTNREIVERVKQLTSLGRVATQTRNYGRPIHSWVASAAEAAIIIKAVRKYLIIKAAQADVALRLRETITGEVRATPLSDEEVTFRQELLAEMRHLNAVSSGLNQHYVKKES